jgi:hypothetical protein
MDATELAADWSDAAVATTTAHPPDSHLPVARGCLESAGAGEHWLRFRFLMGPCDVTPS